MERPSLDNAGVTTGRLGESNGQLEATQLHQYNSEPSIGLTQRDDNTDLVDEPWIKRQVRPIKAFWRSQVVGTVAHHACRDHLALERTYLGYFRTSLALAFVSVIIAQLFRLEHTENSDTILGFFVIGIPLACVFLGAAIAILLLGFYRFWRQQNAMFREKIHAGGWEVNAVGLTVSLVILTLSVLTSVVDKRRDAEVI